jgi:hypothetical protein
VRATGTFKQESIENTFNSRIRSHEQQINNATDDKIRIMHQSGLESDIEMRSHKISEITKTVERADILISLLVNGVITIEEKSL